MSIHAFPAPARRGALVCALLAIALPLLATPSADAKRHARPAAAHRPALAVQIVAPVVVQAGAWARLTGSLEHLRGAPRRKVLVDLQRRKHGRWATIAHGGVNWRHDFRLRFFAPPKARNLVLRLVFRRGEDVLLTSRTWTATLRPADTPGQYDAPSQNPTTTGALSPSTKVIEVSKPIATIPGFGVPGAPTVPEPAAPYDAPVPPDPSTPRQTSVITPRAVEGFNSTTGTMVVDGATSLRPGDDVAVGIGPNTPYGALRKVTSSAMAGGDTVLQTTETTLQDATPGGTIDQHITAAEMVPPHLTSSRSLRSDGISFSRRGKRIHAKFAVKGSRLRDLECSTSGRIGIYGDLSFTPGIDVDASWSLFGGFSAHFIAFADAHAEVGLTAEAGAECTFEQTLWEHHLTPIEFFIGPIPIVILPELELSVGAEGSVTGSLTTGIHADAHAQAGIEYSHGGFHNVSSFTKSYGFDPPSLELEADVGGEVAVALRGLLYGIGGPEVALHAGVNAHITPLHTPFYKITMPISLTAGLTIPVLDIATPEWEVWGHSFLLARGGNPIKFDDWADLPLALDDPIPANRHCKDVAPDHYAERGELPGLLLLNVGNGSQPDTNALCPTAEDADDWALQVDDFRESMTNPIQGIDFGFRKPHGTDRVAVKDLAFDLLAFDDDYRPQTVTVDAYGPDGSLESSEDYTEDQEVSIPGPVSRVHVYDSEGDGSWPYVAIDNLDYTLSDIPVDTTGETETVGADPSSVVLGPGAQN